MKTKKIIAAVLIAVLILSVSVSAFGKMVSAPYEVKDFREKLSDMGFPQYVISAMNDLTKEKVASYNGTFDSSTVQYYSKNMSLISQFEFESGVETDLPIHGFDSPAVNFALFVVNLANGDKALVLDYQWHKLPLNRWADSLGLQWDSSKWYPVEGTFYKDNRYVVSGKNNVPKSMMFDSGNVLKNSCPSGVIWEANLKGASVFQKVTGLYGTGAIVIRTDGIGGGSVQAGYIHKKLGANKALDFGDGYFYYDGVASTYDQLSLFKKL